MKGRIAIVAAMLLIIFVGWTAAAESASIVWRYKVSADCIAVSKDGLAALGSGKEVIVIGGNGQVSWSWEAESAVERLEFSPRGDLFVSSGAQIVKLGVDG